MAMPSGGGRLECDEGVLVRPGRSRHKRIQSTMAWPFKYDLLRGLILNKKEEGVKFNECIIV
jgi:hypothetical protein